MTFETHVHVKSSTVKSVAYDAESETMQVRFQNGALYNYQKVSPKTYHLFFTAESKGRYLNETIKPNCPATKVEEGKKEPASETTETSADEEPASG